MKMFRTSNIDIVRNYQSDVTKLTKIYIVSGKKRGHSVLGITLTNLDTASSFLAGIIRIFSVLKPNTSTSLDGDDVI